MWCPPTPPQDDNDIYIDYSLGFMYDTDIMSESQLPPVYVKKEFKRNRSDAGFFLDNRRPLKIRKEDNYYPPRSLFDRPSPALAKLRRDLKMQRYRGIFKPPPVQIPGLKQQVPLKPLVEPEGMAEWFIYEDISILNVIQQLQGLPLNLMLLSPGHTPNWDLVADIVNQTSRIYRTPKQCRYRYEAVIVPREEGKLIESPKKQKKTKNPLKATPPKGLRAMRSSQLFTNDNNNSFSKLMKVKFDNVKTAFLKKAPQLKQVLVNPSLKNPKHAAVLGEFGITNYDNPPTPIDIAARRVEKLKEKQRGAIPAVQQQLQPQQQPQQPQTQSSIQVPELVQQQQPIQHQQQQQPMQQISTQLSSSSGQTTAIIVQQQPQVQTVATLVQQSPARSQQNLNISHQNSPQIVKAIVASSNHNQSMVTGTVQHIPISQTQQIQHAQQQHQQTIVSQSPVSVVLTTPISAVQQQQQQQQHQNMPPQIVSIHQTVIPSSSAIITQSGSLVQAVQAAQQVSGAQVVSVAQLAGVGTVFTTSCLPSNATVATLTTSSLRAQRIGPGIQEVVLQRPGSQSPTVVSVSGLAGQGVTQAQLQAAQLRLSMGSGVTGVVTKGIPVGSVTGKPINQGGPQSLFFRPQLRQQLKVIHPGQGGQANLVGPTGTIIQGGIVQTAQTVQLQQQGTSQKVAVSSVVSAGSPSIVTNVATVATVQMGPGQAKTQFVKQIGGKQTISTRQATEGEMLLVKRQLISHQQQQQKQLFTPTNIQVQQAGGSNQQQIATLVKASGVGTTGTVGMTISQLKPGTLKTTAIPNQGQMRQIQIQQQQVAMVQQRKSGGKMTQITQVTGKATGANMGGTSTGNVVSTGGQSGIPTQLIVQTPKNLQNTVTVQQIQQAFRQNAQPTGQIVLGKSGVGRVIPVSVSTQPNSRQIQVRYLL